LTEFETININDIKPASYNPRIMSTDEYDKLKTSLDTFGLVDPIIIDLKHDNTIIGGHQRYQVLTEEDDDQDLQLIRLGDIGFVLNKTNIKLNDINDQKALNLALNKITGEWDYSKLDDILDELSEEHYQIELTGFDEEDITLNNDFDFDFFEEDTTENEEELPPDLNEELDGEHPNQNFVIYFSFKNQEHAEKYMAKLGINKKILTGQQLSLVEDKDFVI
jgi:hypothetical protein